MEITDGQLPLVLKQESDRLVDRKNILELNVNRITKAFQSLNEELFHEEVKLVEPYMFDLRDDYLGWVYDKHKGFRSKAGRSQSLRQWLNSTKARKWADSLFGDMFESCRDYAWKVGHCLEDNSEGIEFLTNYLQCEYFIAIMTGAISSGSGSGSRPLICDHSFHKRSSKMLNILNEGTYNNKNSDSDWIQTKSKNKNKKEGNVVKDHFVELYKKWSDRYYALYVMYKTERRHGLRTPTSQKRTEVAKGTTTMDTSMQVDRPTRIKIESERGIENEANLIERKYDNSESDRDENKNERESDEDDGNSSDKPLFKLEDSQVRQNNDISIKKEQEQKKQEREKDKDLERVRTKVLRKLHRENQELKDNMYQMANKIQQLTNYQDLRMSSLYTQLNTWKQFVRDAESKNAEYEDRIKSMSEKIALLDQEKHTLHTRLAAMSQKTDNQNNNGNIFGYNDYNRSDEIRSNMSWNMPFFNSLPNSDLPSLMSESRSHSFLTNMNTDETHTIGAINDFGLRRTSADLGLSGGMGQSIYDWNYSNNEDFTMRRNSSTTGSMNID